MTGSRMVDVFCENALQYLVETLNARTLHIARPTPRFEQK
jgi:hypothetical protein